MRRIFVHLPPFEHRWKEYDLTDDDLRILQLSLMLHPAFGAVVPGTHGIRKIRWAMKGKGKRGGLRVFYVDFPEYSRMYLVTVLRKSDAEDLTREQHKLLGSMVLELGNLLRYKSISRG